MSEPGCHQLLWPPSVNWYDLTRPSAAENLALDEALLTAVDNDPNSACLRFWQPETHFVVLGRSNRAETEVNIDECAKLEIPILRRASGGGTVLVGPGCLCYSLVLPITEIHRQLGITQVTSQLMSRTASGLRALSPKIDVCGTSDLAQGGFKFSGNAQRWLRNSFIHHGTLLFDFDLALMQRCLGHPSREPAYRKSRGHGDFVTNIGKKSSDLIECLVSAWNAKPARCPQKIVDESVKVAASRYQDSEWQIWPRP